MRPPQPDSSGHPPQQPHLQTSASARGRQLPPRQGARPGGQQQQPLLNVHSRAAVREQLRQQQQQQAGGPAGQGAGGVLSDLDLLRSQQSRDVARPVFVSTPLDYSLAGSAYVSGHLTPTDQWVAVGNESSGVISLTSSDNEDEYADSAMVVPATRSVDEKDNVSPYEDSARYSQRRADSAAFQIPLEAQCHDASIPGEPPYYATSPSATHWSAADQGVVNLEAEKAVHLLRESVVSLLSSGGSTTSSASSAQPGGSNINSRRRYGSLQHQSMYRGISRSPSRLSKASEPNYPASAPRRQLMPDLNHFSDVALTSTATPPRHQSTTSASPGHRLGAPPHFPTLEELKQLQQQPLPLPPQSAPHHSGEPLALGVSAPAHPAARFPGRHPLLGDAHQYISEPITTATSQAAWSPFASIRTVSPVLISESGDGNTLGIVSRAQAEAALEQAILCPLKSFTSSNRYNSSSGYVGQNANHTSNAEKAKQDAVERNNSSSSASAAQTWAKYTGYAIVGFGVGTLVGMLCFDMAATTAPKATRTIPIAVGF